MAQGMRNLPAVQYRTGAAVFPGTSQPLHAIFSTYAGGQYMSSIRVCRSWRQMLRLPRRRCGTKPWCAASWRSCGGLRRWAAAMTRRCRRRCASAAWPQRGLSTRWGCSLPPPSFPRRSRHTEHSSPAEYAVCPRRPVGQSAASEGTLLCCLSWLCPQDAFTARPPRGRRPHYHVKAASTP